MAAINIADWYWQATDGRIYTSKRDKIVTSFDAGFIVAKRKGNWGPWPSDASGNQTNDSLNQVLMFYGVTSVFLAPLPTS